MGIQEVAKRVASSDFDDQVLQAAYNKALDDAKDDASLTEYILGYAKYSDEPSLGDFENYLEAYEDYGE